MPAIELRPPNAGSGAASAVQAVQALLDIERAPLSAGAGETIPPCPFKAVCKAKICHGDWTNPVCPGSRKGS